MAAIFKKNKAAIEAYFAKQDLATIISELRLEHLISKPDEQEINSTEVNKRAHTLTKILESKIVNNPDLFTNLKQFLGSFEFEKDFSESPQPKPSTMTVIYSAGETMRQVAPIESQQQMLRSLSSGIGCSSHPVSPMQSSSTHTAATGPHSFVCSSVTTVESSQLRIIQHQKTYAHKFTSGGGASRTHYRNEPSGATSLTYGSSATAKHISVPKSNPAVASTLSRSKKTKRQKSQLHQSNRCEDFRGIEFSSHRSHMMVGHRGNTVRGEGVQLKIPPNSIERGVSINVSLQGCISGPFSLPDDTQLASPVFLVTCTPQYKFQRTVTLTLQHFVHLESQEQCNDILLLISPQMKVEDQDYFYWKFSISDQQPQCFPHISYGEVELTHFSFLCFGIRLSRARPKLFYRVSAHIPERFISPSCSTIYSISILHDIYRENLKKYRESVYPNHNFESRCAVISSKDHGECVSLELPLNEAEELGYLLVSDKDPCTISKSDVNFPILSRKAKKYARRDEETYPPRIVLRVSKIGQSPAPSFASSQTHQLHVNVTGIADTQSVCQGFNLPIQIQRVTVPSIQVGRSADPPIAPGQPTMPELLHFQLNDGSHISIPREVGTHYRSFGTHLLLDSTGSHISALAHREGRNAENINHAILVEWLSGEGLEHKTWATLVTVLSKSGKGELARKIEQAKGT